MTTYEKCLLIAIASKLKVSTDEIEQVRVQIELARKDRQNIVVIHPVDAHA